MSAHQREFQGIPYTIFVDEVRHGWSWSISVGGYCETLNERPARSEEIAISEAQHAAEWYIKNRRGD